MDSAQHCLDQSAECRRLMKLAQSEAEAEALKISVVPGWGLPLVQRTSKPPLAPDSQRRFLFLAASVGGLFHFKSRVAY
jgi:hypothetical protein